MEVLSKQKRELFTFFFMPICGNCIKQCAVTVSQLTWLETSQEVWFLQQLLGVSARYAVTLKKDMNLGVYSDLKVETYILTPSVK